MRILAAIDLSEASFEALRQAHALAEARGASLAVCHVLPNLFDMHSWFPQENQRGMLDLAEKEARARGRVEEQVAQVLGDSEVPVFIETGTDYAEIVRRAEAWSADLIVVGSHGQSGLSRVLLGSVSEKVVRYAHCMVLVARPVVDRGLVVAATDLSEPSLSALKVGAEEAQRRNGRLVALYAMDLSNGPLGLAAVIAGTPFGGTAAVPPRELQAQVHEALTQTLRGAIERLGVSAEAVVVDSSPATGIVSYATQAKAELIFVGTHGHTGLKRVALGSVAEKVVHAAGCSVMVVRLPEDGQS